MRPYIIIPYIIARPRKLNFSVLRGRAISNDSNSNYL
jgi:hypothetical protein